MVDTQGFDVVVQARGSVIRKALRGAWKSATCAPTPTPPGGGPPTAPEQRIPQFRDIPPGTAIGPYSAAGGQVEIPEAGLDASLEPSIGGARLTFGLVIQVEVADPPVPAVAVLNLTANVRADVPIGVADDGKNVVMRLDGLPRTALTSELTGADPIDSRLDVILADYVHAAYVNGSPGVPPDPALPVLPHVVDNLNQFLALPFGASYTVNTHLEIFDDLADPAHRIEVDRPDPAHLRISLPVYLRIFNVRRGGVAPALADPMGLETRIDLLVAVERPPGELRLRFDTATATVGAITPAAGVEGTNYTSNNNLIPGNVFENLLTGQLRTQATDLVHAFGLRSVAVPSSDQIATVLGDLLHADLVSRRSLTLWGPGDSSTAIDIRDVTTRILPDALVIAVNAQAGADAAAITDVVPPDREFAIALDGAIVEANIEAARATNGWADSDLPRRVTHDDTDADVRELDVGLAPGSIHMSGELTVIDAILGSIDVDASFSADVGLHWQPSAMLGPGDVQAMENHLIGDPDVDPEESIAFWIIAIILAIITWGAGSIFIAIIIIVVAAIVSAVASSIGGSMAVDPITGAITGISGWPPELARVGRVRAVFHDPIDIQPDGILLAGTLEVLSSCETTEVLAARSGGSYTGTAQQALSLTAASTSPAAAYAWSPGDGSAGASVDVLPYVYANSGAYVAEHQLTILQPGGAFSRHLALVRIANVPPTVDAGADIVVDEGQVVTLTGSFWDVEPGDTHESMWNFGDAQAPEPGTLTETHTATSTFGTTTVQHAWCDDGVYTVTLRVRDKDGGMSLDTATVTVRNVPPVVDVGPDLYAYPCTVLTLTGAFTDPGWCDTHSALWDFGDCTPRIQGVVVETHEPPAGVGSATAGHTYRTCGTYRARLVVTDDDGASGFDDLTVSVTDVANGSFETGFHRTLTGDVANGWDGYVVGVPVGATHGGRHVWSESVLDGGRRAQGLRAAGEERVGVRQQIGANVGWGYQVTARHTGEPQSPGVARLGVDPSGGTDPAATSVVWSAGGPGDDWAPLTARVTASAATVTVFLEVVAHPAQAGAAAPLGGNRDRSGQVWFDAVQLLAVQPFCPDDPIVPEEPEEPEEPPQRQCFDLKGHQGVEEVPAKWQTEGFVVTTIDGDPTSVLLEGVAGVPALWVGTGLVVDLPFLADQVRVTLFHHGGAPATISAHDDNGALVDSVSLAAHPDAVTVELHGARINTVVIEASGAEVSLVQLCAITDGSRSTPDREREDVPQPPVTHVPQAPAATPASSPRALASEWSRRASGGCC